MTYNPTHYPTALFSEILPNLFQGGTDDNDVIHIAHARNKRRSDMPFDSIVTMYAWARPADWNVQELRYGIRSGLVTALVLIKEGYSPDQAIDLIRAQRGEDALCNSQFEQWLLSSAASFINPPSSLSA